MFSPRCHFFDYQGQYKYWKRCKEQQQAIHDAKTKELEKEEAIKNQQQRSVCCVAPPPSVISSSAISSSAIAEGGVCVETQNLIEKQNAISDEMNVYDIWKMTFDELFNPFLQKYLDGGTKIVINRFRRLDLVDIYRQIQRSNFILDSESELYFKYANAILKVSVSIEEFANLHETIFLKRIASISEILKNKKYLENIFETFTSSFSQHLSKISDTIKCLHLVKYGFDSVNTEIYVVIIFEIYVFGMIVPSLLAYQGYVIAQNGIFKINST